MSEFSDEHMRREATIKAMTESEFIEYTLGKMDEIGRTIQDANQKMVEANDLRRELERDMLVRGIEDSKVAHD